jgi:hypothetical protein
MYYGLLKNGDKLAIFDIHSPLYSSEGKIHKLILNQYRIDNSVLGVIMEKKAILFKEKTNEKFELYSYPT